MVRAPAPFRVEPSRNHPDRRDPIGQRARQHERHASAVRHPVCVDPRLVDVVGRLQLVDQLRDENDIGHARWRLASCHFPGLGTATGSLGIDHDEPMLFGR